MTTLDLGNVSNVFDRNMAAKKPIVVNKGGARSSKSYSLCQLFMTYLFTGSGKNLLITRKTLPALRMTTYKVFINMLKSHNLYDPRAHHMSERTYSYRNNQITFTSIDDHQKMKSSEWNKVLFEEADEFSYEDFMSIKLRMSAPTSPDEPNQIFLALNPSDENDFINIQLLGRDDVELIESTYLDNPFLSKEYREEIERLKIDDPAYWTIYGLGQYSKSRKIIYDNWDVVPSIPAGGGEEFFGLDFGFNNETALVRIRVVDGVPYVKQEIYERGLGTGELIKRLTRILGTASKKSFIYADPEDKRAVEEIYNAGFNVMPAVKEVMNGIEFVKRFKIHVTADSTDLLDEKKKYSWKSDKAGRILDEPIKFHDHAVDALRYGMYSHFLNYGWRAFDNSRPRTIGISKRTHERRSRSSADDYAGY